ncbi:hypothetical protein [Nocardia thraciensis]
MTGDGWLALGFVIAIGLPLTVMVAVIWWPERTSEDRSVEAIRQRVEDEDAL